MDNHDKSALSPAEPDAAMLLRREAALAYFDHMMRVGEYPVDAVPPELVAEGMAIRERVKGGPLFTPFELEESARRRQEAFKTLPPEFHKSPRSEEAFEETLAHVIKRSFSSGR